MTSTRQNLSWDERFALGVIGLDALKGRSRASVSLTFASRLKASAVAKSRGGTLGNPNGAESLRRAGKGGAALRAAVSANAAAFAAVLAPVLDDIRAVGHLSLRAIAAELTARGIRTRRGAK